MDLPGVEALNRIARDGARTILHADMDAFYASVEQRDHPELRGRPVIVGGTGSRGVVSAASYEARPFGVHSAMPTVEARRRCPEGVFLHGEMAKYARESKRIFAIFRRFTPLVEGLSLDEAFLELTGTERLLGPARGVGEQLRRAVREECALPVSVGIAPSKMVAKIASEAAKPDGLVEVQPEALRAFLDPLPVYRIWGVGPVAQARLEGLGLSTIGELARADPERLRASLGESGIQLARLARGEDAREVEPWREPVGMSEENTFGEDVTDPERLGTALIAHAEAVARRLRRRGLRARTLVLKLKLARRVRPGARGYPLLTRRATLAEPSDDGALLARVARELLAAERLAEAVRLIGVGVTNLEGEAAAEQLPLFGPPPERTRRERLNRALDALARRFGPEAVVRGAPGAPARAGLSLQIKAGEEE